MSKIQIRSMLEAATVELARLNSRPQDAASRARANVVRTRIGHLKVRLGIRDDVVKVT